MLSVLKAHIAAIERRVIRNRLARSNPETLLEAGRKWLLPAFRRAARLSPAYRTLLVEAGVDPASIRTVDDFVARCPLLDKANTFRRFPLRELICEDISIADLASILTSSGQGGNGFGFGLSTWRQQRGAARLIDIGLDMAFDVGTKRTLLVNCLPMGVTFQSDLVCMANVSVREDMACAIIDRAGSLFEQIVLCGDPLFLKKLCDYSEEIGLDWKRFRVHVIVGEETFPETFRDYLAGVMNIDPDDPSSGLIGSSMGVGELGLNLFQETRETVALRRACFRDPKLSEFFTGCDPAVSPTPTFMVFNPLRTFVEIINPDEYGVGDLVVTVMDEKAPIPLMRYLTGDRARFVGWRPPETGGPDFISLPSLPMIALHGRAKDRLNDGMHVDHFKELIYWDRRIARLLTGAHRIVLENGAYQWVVQARPLLNLDMAELTERLRELMVRQTPMTFVEIRVMDYAGFPYGKGLDYERKFLYFEEIRRGR